MYQANVRCVPNQYPIRVRLPHAEGPHVDVTIQAQNALIDDEGVVRFFTWDWNDGDYRAYLLHPYAGEMNAAVAWTIDFLVGYGLSRAGSKIIKPAPGMPSAHETAVNVGRYFTFSNPGGHVIRSFISEHFLPKQLGYHAVDTDKLVFLGAITT